MRPHRTRSGRGPRVLALLVVVTLALAALPAQASDSGTDDVGPPPGTVALTFDDGPFEELTPIILEILDRYGVTATFFISAYRFRYNTSLIDDILAAGHSVQTHGFEHKRLVGLPEQQVLEDLRRSIDLIVGAGAPRPTCFRPPYGQVDDTVRAVAKKLGLEVVLWTQNSQDYSIQEPDGVVEATLAGLRSGDIVLMHDQWAPVHAEALPVIIETALSEGLEFAPICVTRTIVPWFGRKVGKISRL